jgi:hypothetical protein
MSVELRKLHKRLKPRKHDCTVQDIEEKIIKGREMRMKR